MFCVILVTANGGRLGMPNYKKKKKKKKKIKTTSNKKQSGTKLDQYQPMVLEISSFSCLYTIFRNGPGGHLG